MTRRRLGALIAAIILLAAVTYIAAAAGHPVFIYNGYDLKEE
jgi:hypothetical protein